MEAFQGATSQLQVEGVQFYHMGQAFWQQRSALTVAGNAQMAGETAALDMSPNNLTDPSFQLGKIFSKPCLALESVNTIGL